MSEKLNSKIAVIGIDIGKNSFHIVGQDRRGALVLRQKWSRGFLSVWRGDVPQHTKFDSKPKSMRIEMNLYVCIEVTCENAVNERRAES